MFGYVGGLCARVSVCARLCVFIWCTDEMENPRKPGQGQRKWPVPPTKAPCGSLRASCLPISIQQTRLPPLIRMELIWPYCSFHGWLVCFSPHRRWFPDSHRSDLIFLFLCFDPRFCWGLCPLYQIQSQFFLSLPSWCLPESLSPWTRWPLSHAPPQPNLFGPLSVRPTSMTCPVFPSLSPLSPTQPLCLFKSRKYFPSSQKKYLHQKNKNTALWYQHVPPSLAWHNTRSLILPLPRV